MLIFPWSDLSVASYIKLSNLKIDGKEVDLGPDIDYEKWIYEIGDQPKNPSKITIYPQNEWDIKDYNLIEAEVIVGLQMTGLDHTDPSVFNFYESEIESLEANLVLHSSSSMTRLSYPLEEILTDKIANQKNMDYRTSVEDDYLFKANIQIPKEYFGLDFTINPTIEVPTSIEGNQVLGIHSGGEPKYSDSILRINFNETEPIIKNGQKIEIKKIYFSTGEPYSKEDGDENVDIEKSLKSEEWWVSTEVDNDDKPFGYVNIDLNSISELLEETTEDTNKDWFFYFKRLKQDEITSTVWKVVMHTVLVKVFKNISDKIDEIALEETTKEELSVSAYEQLSEFEKAALGFFSKRILAINRATDSSENASLEVIREIIQNGPERNIALMNLEIEKFVDIKKSTELVYEMKDDEEEEDEYINSEGTPF
jgi:hypothetical protein